jgi:anti-sigma factor RsiW
MMDGAHPDELELLELVEEELPEARKAAVAEHVAACSHCAESVRQLETARYALRSAPLLELPGQTRDAALAALPERAVRKGWSWRPRLVVPVLATAAVAAVVAGVVLTGDFDREEGRQSAEVATLEASAGQDAGAAVAPEESATETDMSRALLDNEAASVEGPPREVVRVLRRRGFDAKVVESTVLVRDAEAEEVRRALVGRPAGPVPVIVP